MGEKGESGRRSDRVLAGMSRVVVSLMWGLLLVMLLVVAYLAARFYGPG